MPNQPDMTKKPGKSKDLEQPSLHWLAAFQPPTFVPHRFLRGGHLQTLIGAKMNDTRPADGCVYQKHHIDLPDGDALAIHDDTPENWQPERGSVMMIHGICGCHAAAYMIRFHQRLNAIGIRTFRLDMRGCGHSADLCQSITHAGRSEDVLSAIDFIGDLIDEPESPIGCVGVSLGGNQLLLAAGQVGRGTHAPPRAWPRVGPILAIAPPIDLQSCSDRLQSRKLRFYNRYFIKHLLRRASPTLLQNPVWKAALSQRTPKTLRHFDRLFTAPVGGFESETHYYRDSSAIDVLQHINKTTLIVTAADDPLVPVSSFETVAQQIKNSDSVRLLVTPKGGHHGYLQRDRTSWSDELVTAFFDDGINQAKPNSSC